MGTAAAAPATQMTPTQQDRWATQMILAKAIDRQQVVGQQTVVPAVNPIYFLQPTNIGFVKRFKIIVSGTFTNTGSQTATLTEYGLSNLFGQGGVQYTDLNNFLRTNTSGKHLTMIAQAKRRYPYYDTKTNGFGRNTATAVNMSGMMNVDTAAWPVFTAPQTIASGASANFSAIFELPICYTDDDLRGGVWTNVLNAVQSIQLTLNVRAFTANPSDDTFAVYSGPAGNAGVISTATIVVYQEYLDQLPKAMVNGQLTTILPNASVSTAYQLMSSIQSAITPNQEFNIPYSNQRSFASTILEYNNSGASGGRVYGTDMNYLALQAANSAYIWKNSPNLVTAQSRDHIKTDLPAGVYYLPSRRRNIATQQYGNMELTINPLTAGAGAYANVMWEQFAPLNTLTSGPSLASS